MELVFTLGTKRTIFPLVGDTEVVELVEQEGGGGGRVRVGGAGGVAVQRPRCTALSWVVELQPAGAGDSLEPKSSLVAPSSFPFLSWDCVFVWDCVDPLG